MLFFFAIATNLSLIQPVQDQTSALVEGFVGGNDNFPSTDGVSMATLSISYKCEDVTSYLSSA